MSEHITVEPGWSNDELRGGVVERSFLISRTDGGELSLIDAVEALLEETPESIHGGDLVRMHDPDMIRLADDWYSGMVRYVSPGRLLTPETGEVEINFDIGWQMRRVMQSLATINTFTEAGVTAPDFQGAIGVTDDGVQGADVDAGGFIYSRTEYLDNTAVGDPQTFAKTVAEFVGTVNSAAVGAFAAGELLLIGASLANRPGEDDWQFSLRWAQRENISDLDIGDIEGIAHDGWDLRWVYYQQEVDEDADLIVRTPLAVYIERIFFRTNHNLLPGMGA